MTYLGILLSNALLSALSIANLGIISSMVGFKLDQKHHVGAYEVYWPDQTVHSAVLPEHLWTDHRHESNGVAGYEFFLGLFGVFVGFRQRSRIGKASIENSSRPACSTNLRSSLRPFGFDLRLPRYQSDARSANFIKHRDSGSPVSSGQMDAGNVV